MLFNLFLNLILKHYFFKNVFQCVVWKKNQKYCLTMVYLSLKYCGNPEDYPPTLGITPPTLGITLNPEDLQPFPPWEVNPHRADFIKKGTFSVHSFNDDYLSIWAQVAKNTFFIKSTVSDMLMRRCWRIEFYLYYWINYN